nr:MAG TPA: hypothetical protein [Caudoviricetes sp.]
MVGNPQYSNPTLCHHNIIHVLLWEYGKQYF